MSRGPLDRLVSLVALDADLAWLSAPREVPAADRMRAALRAALQCAVNNRLVALVPEDEWPEHVVSTTPATPKGIL